MARRESGQTIIEFALGSGLALAAVAGAGLLIQTQWERSKCAHRVFESVHSRLTGRRPTPGAEGIVISESALAVTGVGRCGRSVERVTLPKLEFASW